MKLELLAQYFGNAVGEEFLFRLTPFYLLPLPIAYLISSVVYGVAHFHAYDWRMVATTTALGLLLGFVFTLFHDPIVGWLVCVVLHTVAGVIAYMLDLHTKWHR